MLYSVVYGIHKGIVLYILNGTRNIQKLGKYAILLYRYCAKWIFQVVFDEYDNIKYNINK
jgi:hypothetical protein